MFCGLRKWATLLLILYALLAVYRIVMPNPQINDTEEYQFAAKNLVENNLLYSGEITSSMDFRLFSKRSLGYPLFLSLQLNHGVIVVVAQFVLLFVSFLLGLFCLQALRAKFVSFTLYSILFLLTPAILLHSFFVLTDLLLMLVITSMCILWIESKLTSKHSLVIFSVLWAFGLLLKPILLPSLFLIPIFLVFFRNHKSVGFVLLPVFVFLLQGSINKINTNTFEFSSISTINLTKYNAKLTIAHKYGIDSAQKFVEIANITKPQSKSDYAKYKNTSRSIGVSVIKENFLTYTKVHILGIVKMLADPGRFEIYTFFGEPTSEVSLTEHLFDRNWSVVKEALLKKPLLIILLVIGLIINMLRIVGIFGLGKARSKNILILLGLISYFLILTGPVGAARFLLPVTVILLISTSLGWSYLLKKGPES